MRKKEKLKKSERDEIELLFRKGHSLRSIAGVLNRSPNTVWYEITINGGRTGYRAAYAHQYARTRLKDRRFQYRKIEHDTELRAYVISGLKAHWNPDEIAGAMQRAQQPFYASKTAIYDWLRSAYGQPYCRYLYSGRYRARQRTGKKTKKVLIPNRVSIHRRFRGAHHRSRYGHWEGDTLMGRRGTPGGLKVVQERKSRLIRAVRVTSMRPAEHAKKLEQAVYRARVRSMTFDNGIENRDHTKLRAPTFFCDPYASWQKGGVEHANRMLRRYFPKGTDFSLVSAAVVRRAVSLINKKPRRVLGYRSALEVARAGGIINQESVLIQG